MGTQYTHSFISTLPGETNGQVKKLEYRKDAQLSPGLKLVPNRPTSTSPALSDTLSLPQCFVVE